MLAIFANVSYIFTQAVPERLHGLLVASGHETHTPAPHTAIPPPNYYGSELAVIRQQDAAHHAASHGHMILLDLAAGGCCRGSRTDGQMFVLTHQSPLS